MSETKIIQYIHRPNMTELGLGNTHETYLLVDSKTDMSKVFPLGKDTIVEDILMGKSYVLRSAKPSEFRINQMGPIFRDYNVMPGDEIVITHYDIDGEISNVLSVRNYDRVCLSANGDRTEIVNFERLQRFLQNDNSYSLKVAIDGLEKTIKIVFLESRKKRSDSPNETDYYKVTLDDVPLANGKYYLTIANDCTLTPSLPKSEFNQVVLDESYGSKLLKKKGAKDTNKQIIYFGAPGTGKSFEIDRITKNKEVIRTTFHPDSDYSTFVGAYKPTSIEVPVRDVTGKVIVENGKQVTENRIVYEFVEQAFLQAYTKAWAAYSNKADGEKAEEQYLVIEEINRGNCAQIFGDLFQLLDRNGYGFSDYPITADKDMKKQLAKAFKGITILDAERINDIYGKDIVAQVLNGDILLLPDNLYIWATMNTSDQSLFPIDSAFKRRWDWKYMPICEGKDNGVSLGWKIKVKGHLYDWWQFVEKINAEINEQTKSEDKKLGYFFCKAQNGIVSAEIFVSKVIFYLWNDVFKDQAFASDIFRDGEEELTFNKFYDVNANGKAVVKEDKVELFLQNLGVGFAEETIVDDEAEEEDNSAEGGSKHKSLRSVTFPDGTVYSVENLTHFDVYVESLKKMGLDQVYPLIADMKYRRKGCPMMSTEELPGILNSDFTYQKEGNYYIVKGAIDDTLINILSELKNKLNLDIQVDFE